MILVAPWARSQRRTARATARSPSDRSRDRRTLRSLPSPRRTRQSPTGPRSLCLRSRSRCGYRPHRSMSPRARRPFQHRVPESGLVGGFIRGGLAHVIGSVRGDSPQITMRRIDGAQSRDQASADRPLDLTARVNDREHRELRQNQFPPTIRRNHSARWSSTIYYNFRPWRHHRSTIGRQCLRHLHVHPRAADRHATG